MQVSICVLSKDKDIDHQVRKSHSPCLSQSLCCSFDNLVYLTYHRLVRLVLKINIAAILWLNNILLNVSFDVHFSYLQLLLIMWIRLSKTRIFQKICGKLNFLKAPHVWISKNFCFKVNFTFWFLSSQTLEFFQTWIQPCVWALFSFLLGVTLLCYIATLCVNWGTPQNLWPLYVILIY